MLVNVWICLMTMISQQEPSLKEDLRYLSKMKDQYTTENMWSFFLKSYEESVLRGELSPQARRDKCFSFRRSFSSCSLVLNALVTNLDQIDCHDQNLLTVLLVFYLCHCNYETTRAKTKGPSQKFAEACETNNVSFILNPPPPPPWNERNSQNRLQRSTVGNLLQKKVHVLPALLNVIGHLRDIYNRYKYRSVDPW